MKKLILIGLILGLTWCLLANAKPKDSSMPSAAIFNRSIVNLSRDMNEPVISWSISPRTIKVNNYYDYMIGGYQGSALQVQPTSLGIYLVYMFKSSNSSRRSVNYAQLDYNATQPQFEGSLTDCESSEGYVTMAIDPVSQNPFFTWHAQYNAVDNNGNDDSFYNCYLSADNYSSMSSPGSPFTRIRVIENTCLEYEYNWPVIFVGNSPNPNQRRVYVFASNAGMKPSDGKPSSSVKMAWADFSTSLFEGEALSMSWNYRTFDYFEAIHNTPLTVRAFPSFAVKDNLVVMGGFVMAKKGISSSTDTTNIIYQPHNVFYLVNQNYGEGDFTTYTFNTNRAVPNPTNQGGVSDSTGLCCFEVRDSYSLNRNLVFDNLNRVHFIGNYATTFLDSATATEDSRKYWTVSQTLKDVVFEINDHSLRISDLEPKSVNPYDNLLFPVWDLNEDDIPDSYDTEGNWEFQFMQTPEGYYQSNDWFHYNYFRQTSASPEGWMVGVWSDCTKSYAYSVLSQDEYSSYAQVPELALIISRDNGKTWSSAKYINSLVTPELANMIPSFAYLTPQIQVIDNTIGRVHLMFVNDNSYGSYIQADGTNTGCNVMYAAIDIDFTQFTNSDDPIVITKPVVLKQNYPNPFNPQTIISFNLISADKVNLSVYNIRGQHVNTLVNGNFTAGSHEVIWNGLDKNGKQVSSGVYFYKLATPSFSSMKRMVLIK